MCFDLAWLTVSWARLIAPRSYSPCAAQSELEAENPIRSAGHAGKLPRTHAAREPAMISASHVDNATDCCFFMPQAIAASDSIKL
eukprot:6195524-Pleurochrysis_carterae.AAC.3